MKNSLATTAIVAILVGALSFYGGMQYQKTRTTSALPGNTQQHAWGNMRNGQPPGESSDLPRTGGSLGNRPIMGEITAADDTSITVKDVSGGSTIVMIASSTTITKSTDATITDLVVGSSVNVRGSRDSSGTVTAESISLTEPLMEPAQ
jgi:hypothetical protein